jgi:peptide alpha-N-acetyltransferase
MNQLSETQQTTNEVLYDSGGSIENLSIHPSNKRITTTMAEVATTKSGSNDSKRGDGIVFVDYRDESRLEDVDRLVSGDLSEPYSIFTYRYFLTRFPDLCILAVDEDSGDVCGCVVGKIDTEDAPAPVEAMVVEATNDGDNEIEGKKGGNIAQDTAIIPQNISNGNIAIIQTGYIGMLAVSKSHRRRGIGKDLVRQVLQRMKNRACESVTLETVSASPCCKFVSVADGSASR